MEFPTHSRSNCAVINCTVKTEGKTVRLWGGPYKLSPVRAC